MVSRLKIPNFKSNTAFLSFVMVFSYPLLVITIIGWFIIPELKLFFKEIIGIGFTTVISMVIFLCFSYSKLKVWLGYICLFLLSISVFIKLSFYYHYETTISISALYVIFETYFSETSDFVINYFDSVVIGLLILLFLPLILFVLLIKTGILSLTFKSLKYYIVSLLLVTGIVFCINWKFKNENLVLISYYSYIDYKQYKNNLKSTLSQTKSQFINVVSFDSVPQTNIVILGESTSSWHMQLYGYERETNPLLTEIKDELFVFDSVIAPNVHTIIALDKILTLSDYYQPQKKDNASIVQLANEANYTTYWLSNQRPIGLHESVSAQMANASHYKTYVNVEDYMKIIYDEALLPKLNDILNETADRKLIFIHLIGTHIDFDKRYPESFSYFKDSNSKSKFKSKKATKSINSYDNAVRYNDFIVRSIIEKARASKSIGYVVYFSDHGDEVFDTMNFLGHNEYHATRPMYEVPFIVWLSENYKSAYPDYNNLNLYTKRPYSLEHFIHSFSDLSHIKFDKFDETKSIFNPKFEKRTRWIKQNIDYDNR